MTKQNQTDLMMNKNGVKSRCMGFKIEKLKRNTNSFFKSNRSGHSDHL